jgi:hypothetical protein
VLTEPFGAGHAGLRERGAGPCAALAFGHGGQVTGVVGAEPDQAADRAAVPAFQAAYLRRGPLGQHTVG